MVLDSYSDVTFSCNHKDVVTKAVVALFTMAESEESVPSVSTLKTHMK